MPPVKRCRQQVCLGKRCQRQPSANHIHTHAGTECYPTIQETLKDMDKQGSKIKRYKKYLQKQATESQK